MDRIETPCKNNCLYSSRLGYCKSCGRTLDDLSVWSSTTKEDRIKRMKQAKQRLRGKDGI